MRVIHALRWPAVGASAATLALLGSAAYAEPTPAPTAPSDVTIAQIQGTDAASPLVEQQVATTGVVTALLPGRGGYTIQMPAGEVAADFKGSTGLFVQSASVDGLDIGQHIRVAGTVKEINDLTTLVAAGDATPVPDSQAAPIEPLQRPIPRGSEAESFESMLIQPTGTYRVSGNAELAYTGQLTLNDGDKPLLQPTQAGKPGSAQAQAQADFNAAHMVTLDDGNNAHFDVKHYEKFPPQPPISLPYLWPGKPGPTLGAEVTFKSPVVMTYVDKLWVADPVRPNPTDADISFSQVREAAPAQLGGNFKVATFNVLNFFTDLGVDATDVDGEGKPLCQPVMNLWDNSEPVSGNWDCPRRGAWDKAGLQRQEAKIVKAINALGDAGAQIVALQEIENGVKFGPDYDVALKYLVQALNAADPAQGWDYAPAPATMPTYGNDDVIRQAFIYKPAAVKLAGPSVFLDDPAFVSAADARAPLAQSFTHLASGKTALLINNHLTYKGGKVVGEDNANPGDNLGPAWDTGRNNGDRTRQAQALATFAPAQAQRDHADFTLLVGDFNAYSYETPIQTLVEAGFADLMNPDKYPSEHKTTPWNEYTYSFRSTFGNLDHALIDGPAQQWLVGHDIWTANAYEAQVYEYSRYRFTETVYYTPDVFRASDHNAALIAFDLPTTAQPAPTPTTPEPTTPVPTEPGPTAPVPTAPAPSVPAPSLPAPSVPAPSVPAPSPGPLPITGTSAGMLLATSGVLAALGGALAWRRRQVGS